MSEAANTHRIRLLDSTLRDGSHGIRHRYTPQQVELIAGKLDEAGVHSIGVGHGDGLGASSIQYMRSLHSDDELLTAGGRYYELWWREMRAAAAGGAPGERSSMP